MKLVQRFLATGDLQVHQWREFANLDKGINSRLLNILSVFDTLREYASANNIDQVFINGDIFEQTGAIDTLTYNRVYEAIESFRDYGISLILNVGNHDVVGEDPQHPGYNIHSLLPFRRIATVVEQPGRLGHVLVVPWEKPEKFLQRMAILGKDEAVGLRGEPFVLMTHCGVSGATSGPTQRVLRSPIKLQDLHPEKFQLILLSDYHTEQKLEEHVFYLGSPVQHTFGEIHEPGIWDISLFDQSPWFKAKKIPTNLPRFVSVAIENTKDLKKLAKWKGHYLRVVVSSPHVAEADLEAALVGLTARVDWQLPDSPNATEAQAVPDADDLIRQWVEDKKAQPRLIQIGRRLLGL